MATQTKIMASGFDPNNQTEWRVEIDYDDVTMRVQRLRCVNPTTKAVTISATSTASGRNYSASVPANTALREVAIGQTQAQKLQLTLTASGKLDGVEYRIVWG